MTTEVNSRLLARWAVGERHVVIRDIVEEVDFFLLQEQAGRDGMNRRISPSLIEEAAVLVERLKKVEIRFGSQPFKAADFEVRPLVQR